MKKITLLGIITFVLCHTLQAQSFAELKTKRGKRAFTDGFFGIYARFTMLDGKYTEPYSGLTGNLFLKKDRLKKGERRYRFEHPLVGDFLFVIARDGSAILNDRMPPTTKTEQNFSSGWMGWHRTYWNISAQPRKILSVGLSYGDYIFGSRRLWSGTPIRIQEPAGYYFYVGPAVLGSFLINKTTWIDAYANVDINVVKAAKPTSGYQEVKGYPLPKNFVLGADVYTTSKWYGGVRINQLFDTGAEKDRATRIDLSAGIFFTL